MSAPDAALLLEELRKCGGDGDRDIEVFAEIDSTSSELLRRLERGAAAPGALVMATAQTKGRGRCGRTWASPPVGNLYASLVVAVEGPPAKRVPLVPLAAGVAAVEALAAQGVFGVLLKWPNDLLRRGRKVGGILCEARAIRGDSNAVVVGFGLNAGACEFEGPLAETAACLDGVLRAGPEGVAAAWVAGLERWARRLARGEIEPLVAAWVKLAEPFGRRVRVGGVEGTTVGLDAGGLLLIEVCAGNIVAVPGGIVEEI